VAPALSLINKLPSSEISQTLTPIYLEDESIDITVWDYHTIVDQEARRNARTGPKRPGIQRHKTGDQLERTRAVVDILLQQSMEYRHYESLLQAIAEIDEWRDAEEQWHS
jgi:hypothetical protein